jgi:hypothetical protein
VILLHNIDFGAVVGKRGISVFFKWLKMISKVAIGSKIKNVMREDTRMKSALQIVVLPFEDYETAEGTRLKLCSSVFAYPNSKKGDIKYIPTCAWERHKNIIMRQVAEMFNKPDYKN